MPLFRTYQPGQTNPKAKPKTPDLEPSELPVDSEAAGNDAETTPQSTPTTIKRSRRPRPTQPAEAATTGEAPDAGTAREAPSAPGIGLGEAADTGGATTTSGGPAGLRPKRGPKSAPTPTRDEALAARKALINPTLTPKEAKERARANRRAQTQGRYRASEMTPDRVLLRNFVDARFSVGELLFPLMIVIVLLTFVSRRSLALAYATSVATIIIFCTWIVSITVNWIRFKRLLKRRLPGTDNRGLFIYMVNRMMVIPRWRRPEPVVKRGEKI